MTSILITDDEERQRVMLKNILEMDKYTVYTASNMTEGLEIVRKKKVDIIVSDYKMENETGEEFLEKIKLLYSDVEFIIVTAFGSIETAVRCMKKGAFGFITKPVDIDELRETIRKAVETKELKDENRELKEIINSSQEKINIIGESPEITEIKEVIDRVACLDVPVLIEGNTGTGKELAARAIHYNGNRKNEPFIAVNMAGIPENLIESELFGHEKGSFTGAVKDKKGKFELAGSGTIFLDEIGEMNIDLQSKLLRVLQEEEIQRVGSETTIKTKCRIVAATNRELEKEIKKGKFREDLYYRLNLIKIELPALIKRKGDIVLLIKYFIAKYARKYGIDENTGIKYIERISELYKDYDFPGNIRELENIVERYMIFPDKKAGILEAKNSNENFENRYFGKTLEEIEKEAILQTLEKLGGNKKRTAEMIGLSERGLRNKLNLYGIIEKDSE